MISTKTLLLGALALMLGTLAACGKDEETKTKATLPSVSMKCNGQPCFQ